MRQDGLAKRLFDRSRDQFAFVCVRMHFFAEPSSQDQLHQVDMDRVSESSKCGGPRYRHSPSPREALQARALIRQQEPSTGAKRQRTTIPEPRDNGHLCGSEGHECWDMFETLDSEAGGAQLKDVLPEVERFPSTVPLELLIRMRQRVQTVEPPTVPRQLLARRKSVHEGPAPTTILM